MTKKNTTNAKNPSTRKGADSYTVIIDKYLAAINSKYKTGTAREHSYRPALVALLEELIPNSDVINDGAQIECGAPDCTIIDQESNLVVGYVEAKDIGVGDLDGKRSSGNKEQFDRYKASLDNIAFTDYLEFVFYKKGERIDAVRIGEVTDDGIQPLPENFDRFLSLMERLGNAEPQSITSPTQLARLMAAKARLLQVAAQKFLSGGKAEGSRLWKLMEDFRRVLLPDTNKEQFADIYAQTLTYGFFVARLHDNTDQPFTLANASALVPQSNPFLQELFDQLSHRVEKDIVWIVEDIVRLFASANVSAIMKDYGKTTKQSDPMIHFYEDFLAAYDAGLRKDRGVWYTPLPVVRFIVRAVDDLLAAKFGIVDGLASRDKVEIEVAENCDTGKRLTKKVKKIIPKVQILDPATGTGTFLAECVNRIYGKFKKNAGKWTGYVTEDLIPRLNGFEILMSPYTMAHIKLDLVLSATGYRHMNDQRFNVFLTNSLEEYKESLGPLFSMALGEEAAAANAVKRDCPVMVVIGNPPYSGESQNKGETFKEFMKLMDDYKMEPGGTERLKERNPKWLNDDYVKFLRLAQYYIEKDGKRDKDGKEGRTGTGIVGYINPHGFLDNPTFRGMRWHLLKTFDEIYVLNLHGNAKKHEVCPDGSKDENVFTIMQGVSINIFVKTGKKPDNALGKVYYADLWGTRKGKYKFLESTDFADVDYKEVKPIAPMYFFVPKDFSLEDVYSKGFSVVDLFDQNSMGVTSGNDKTLVAYSNDDLIDRVTAEYGTADNSYVRRISYRPFDKCYIYYKPDLLARARNKFFSLVHEDTLELNLIRICSRDADLHVLASEGITDKTILSSKDNANVFPLYLYQDTLGHVEKVPNFDKEIFERIADGLKRKPSPEELFDYIYAVLHTPEYRERYKEFLKVDFPRIPYPMNAAVFKKLAKIGGELRETHLLKTSPSTSGRKSVANFPIDGNRLVEDVRFVNGKVYINDEQYFDHVPEEAWGMFIGGYQPAQKWLKDRKGRTLSLDDIEHYQAIIPALMRTRALMQKLSALSKDWLK